jgi:hypothetical protein
MNSKELKKKALRIFKEMDRSFYCKICKRHFPSGDYCVERHFDRVHPDIKSGDWADEEDCKWDLHEWTDAEIRKLIDRIFG